MSIYIRTIENKALLKILASCGVPYVDLPPKNFRFKVDDNLVKIEPEIPNVLAKNITVPKQLKALTTVIKNPLKGAYVLGISSFPTDQRAKYLAIKILATASVAYKKENKTSKTLPVWHRVYGSFGDTLRDRPKDEPQPSLVILTNVMCDSTALKLEKVRDILEMYSDVPRIVVTAGQQPTDLFANKLKYPMTVGVYLGPENRVKQL